MNNKPTKQELARIKNFAHKCYGYMLSDSLVLDIWNLCHSTTPVLRRSWPLPHVIKSIARGHLECWEALKYE